MRRRGLQGFSTHSGRAVLVIFMTRCPLPACVSGGRWRRGVMPRSMRRAIIWRPVPTSSVISRALAGRSSIRPTAISISRVLITKAPMACQTRAMTTGWSTAFLLSYLRHRRISSWAGRQASRVWAANPTGLTIGGLTVGRLKSGWGPSNRDGPLPKPPARSATSTATYSVCQIFLMSASSAVTQRIQPPIRLGSAIGV